MTTCVEWFTRYKPNVLGGIAVLLINILVRVMKSTLEPSIREMPYDEFDVMGPSSTATTLVIKPQIFNHRYIVESDVAFTNLSLVAISTIVPLLVFTFVALYNSSPATVQRGLTSSTTRPSLSSDASRPMSQQSSPNNKVAAVTDVAVTTSPGLDERNETNAYIKVITLFFLAHALNGLITDGLKNYVGAFRPNFFEMCEWSDVELKCMGEREMEELGRRSFPSGHASTSMCGCSFLSLYLSKEIFPIIQKRPITRYLAIISPILMALWCAASRVHDYWHHPADVLAGSAIGLACSAITFEVFWDHMYEGGSWLGR